MHEATSFNRPKRGTWWRRWIHIAAYQWQHTACPRELPGTCSRLQTTRRLTAVNTNCDTVTGFISICASKRGLAFPLGHHTRDGVSIARRGMTSLSHPRHGPARFGGSQGRWPRRIIARRIDASNILVTLLERECDVPWRNNPVYCRSIILPRPRNFFSAITTSARCELSQWPWRFHDGAATG